MLKLQEYRISDKKPNVKRLEHVMVLEEAHNLLKRTSTEQSGESSNVLGKSVEMLTNAIAELRAFGEGFIIADQSPGLLDMSVIRNTNTKIIHRLPEESDRLLVGKAMGLSEEQIYELSKLETGVAAIYQNNWIESVLCKVDELKSKDIRFHEYTFTKKDKVEDVDALMWDTIVAMITNKKIERVKIDKLKADVIPSNLSVQAKVNALEFFRTKELAYAKKMLGGLIKVPSKKYVEMYEDVTAWIDEILVEMNPHLIKYSQGEKELLLYICLPEVYRMEKEYEITLRKYKKWMKDERGIK